MKKAKIGDKVKVHYICRLEDGTVFDRSDNRNPIEFVIGKGKFIPGFENAIIGMCIGESKSSNIPASKAYGPYREEMAIEVDRDMLPKDMEPKVGMKLELNQPDSNKVIVSIKDISESKVILDANHPLAGKELYFDIKLIEIF